MRNDSPGTQTVSASSLEAYLGVIQARRGRQTVGGTDTTGLAVILRPGRNRQRLRDDGHLACVTERPDMSGKPVASLEMGIVHAEQDGGDWQGFAKTADQVEVAAGQNAALVTAAQLDANCLQLGCALFEGKLETRGSLLKTKGGSLEFRARSSRGRPEAS